MTLALESLLHRNHSHGEAKEFDLAHFLELLETDPDGAVDYARPFYDIPMDNNVEVELIGEETEVTGVRVIDRGPQQPNFVGSRELLGMER